jgi:DnaJ-class molecular chaperone
MAGTIKCKCGRILEQGDMVASRILDSCPYCNASQDVLAFNPETNEFAKVNQVCEDCGEHFIVKYNSGDKCPECEAKNVPKKKRIRKPGQPQPIQEALKLLANVLIDKTAESGAFAVLERWSEMNKLTVRENCMNNIMLKIARIDNSKSVLDSLLDIAGYAILAYAYERTQNGNVVHEVPKDDN